MAAAVGALTLVAAVLISAVLILLPQLPVGSGSHGGDRFARPGGPVGHGSDTRGTEGGGEPQEERAQDAAARAGRTPGRGAADHRAAGRQPAGPVIRPGAEPAVRPAAEPEVCAGGRDPAESLRPSAGAGKAVKRIQDSGRLVVGVDQNSYLWGYRDPHTGNITGFDIDLVKAIATDLLGPKPRIVYRTIPTNQRIRAVQDGEVDMVVRTMSITCQRLADVAFSTAYFEAGQQLLAPENSGIDGYNASLKDRKVCTAQGSTGQTQLKDENHGATPVYVRSQLDCLVLLQLGEVHAVLTDNALAAGQAAQDPSVRLVGDPITVEPYGVAMNLDDEDLVRRVNKVLDDYRAGGEDSRWSRAYGTWLADLMRDPDDPSDTDPMPPTPAYRD